MTQTVLHGFCQSGNCYKVALYLACAGIPFENRLVDYFNGETRGQSFRTETNEMGEAPVLEWKGRRLTQSGAILTVLADDTGKFAPPGPEGRYEALRWILFDNHKFTSYFATYRFLYALAPEAPAPAVQAFLKSRTEAAFAIVDKHLAANPFMLGKTPTIADFSIAGYLFFPKEEHGIDFKESYPNLHAWMDRIRALPGFKGPSELLPGQRRPVRVR